MIQSADHPAQQRARQMISQTLAAGIIRPCLVPHHLIGTATCRSKAREALIEGRPDVLIHHGTLFTAVMLACGQSVSLRSAVLRPLRPMHHARSAWPVSLFPSSTGK